MPAYQERGRALTGKTPNRFSAMLGSSGVDPHRPQV